MMILLLLIIISINSTIACNCKWTGYWFDHYGSLLRISNDESQSDEWNYQVLNVNEKHWKNGRLALKEADCGNLECCFEVSLSMNTEGSGDLTFEGLSMDCNVSIEWPSASEIWKKNNLDVFLDQPIQFPPGTETEPTEMPTPISPSPSTDSPTTAVTEIPSTNVEPPATDTPIPMESSSPTETPIPTESPNELVTIPTSLVTTGVYFDAHSAYSKVSLNFSKNTVEIESFCSKDCLFPRLWMGHTHKFEDYNTLVLNGTYYNRYLNASYDIFGVSTPDHRHIIWSEGVDWIAHPSVVFNGDWKSTTRNGSLVFSFEGMNFNVYSRSSNSERHGKLFAIGSLCVTSEGFSIVAKTADGKHEMNGTYSVDQKSISWNTGSKWLLQDSDVFTNGAFFHDPSELSNYQRKLQQSFQLSNKDFESVLKSANTSCFANKVNYNCLYSPWSEWTFCQNTNATSTRYRAKTLIAASTRTGSSCLSTIQEEEFCNGCLENTRRRLGLNVENTKIVLQSSS